MSGRKEPQDANDSQGGSAGEVSDPTLDSSQDHAEHLPARPAVERRERHPLTENDWRELLQVVLRDIQVWSEARGRGNVPPVEFLRQLTHFVDAMSTLRYSSGGQDSRSRP